MLFYEDFTLENFVRHVENLYSVGSNSQRMISVKWLETFQNREEAWVICYGALSGNYSFSINHYAALILKNKIENKANELPEDFAKSIFEFLFQFLNKNLPQMRISKEVILAIAYLVARTSFWTGQFHSVITQLASIPAGENTQASAHDHGVVEPFAPQAAVVIFMYEYLLLIKRGGKAKKRTIAINISSNWESILPMMDYLFSVYINGQSPKRYDYLTRLIHITQRLQSIVRTRTMEVFKSNSFGYICQLAQEYDQDAQLIDSCSVCIRSVLSSLSSQEVVRESLYKYFISFCNSLHPNILKAIEDFNIHYLMSILEITNHLAETYFSYYLKSNHEEDYTFIRIGFEICLIHDFKVLMIFLEFWDDFSKYDDREENSHSKFRLFTQKYCDLLVKEIMRVLPLQEAQLNKNFLIDDDNKDLLDFRDCSISVLRTILKYVNCEDYYNQILALFSDPNMKFYSLIDASILLVWTMIYQPFDLNYEPILHYICRLPPETPPYVLITSCEFLRDFISKLSRPQRQKYKFIVEFLYECIKRPSILPDASEALDLCIESGMDDINTIESLQVINDIVLCTCDCANYPHLIALFANKFYLINIPNKDKLLLDISLSQLREVMIMINKNIQFTKPAQSDCIDNLGTFFKELVKHELDPIFYCSTVDQLINIIFTIIEYSISSENVCEKSCRLIKHTFKLTANTFNYEIISNKIIELFKKTGYSCFVYTFNSLYELLHDRGSPPAWLDGHFHTILELVFNKFQNKAPKDNPFLVEDFMRLCKRALSINEYKVLLMPSIERVLMIASIGLQSHQRSTFRASYTLIYKMFDPELFKKKTNNDTTAIRSQLIHLFESRFPSIMRCCIDFVFSKSSDALIEMCGSLLYRIILFEKAYSNAPALNSSQALAAECRRFSTNETFGIISTYVENMLSCRSYREAGLLSETLSRDLYGE